MGLGPVLRHELIATTRRPRYYLGRFAYGLFLLYALASGLTRLPARRLTIRDMTLVGNAFFLNLTWAQWMAILVLMPAMTAGVIADAHRRKTLRDMLASGLSGRAIVLGKLGARLVQAGAFVALGLPIVAILGLLGGLDPWSLFYAYAGTASIALAVGGVSILASTLASRPREAVIAAYALELAWLGIPMAVGHVLVFLPWPFHRLNDANQWLLASSPPVVWSRLNDARMDGLMYRGTFPAWWAVTRANEAHAMFLVMMAIQAALGVGCVAIAVLLLRPLRAEGGGWSRLGIGPRRLARARLPVGLASAGRRPCGDAPMLWKECHGTPRGGLARLASRPMVLLLGTLLGCVLFEAARPAFRETYLGQASIEGRIGLNAEVRQMAAYLFTGFLLVAATAGAASVSSEREDDTWTSLTATLLTGGEVVRGKVVGALWAGRWLGLAWLGVIGVGVACGAVHPAGALAAALGMAAFGGFAAALGVFVSLEARTSTRALVTTVVLLIVANVALPVVALTLWGVVPSALLVVGTTPLLEWLALLSYPEFAKVWAGGSFFSHGPSPQRGLILAAIVFTSLALHACAACGLVARASAAYDRVVGRARRGAAPD